MKPKISIITATYNSERTLENSIKSVLSQHYENIEYIIIDGGSNDSTISIIDKYKDSIAYWVSEKDKGIYDAWNKGLLKATGDWIAFLGSDDYFLPNALNEYAEFIALEGINNRDCLYVSAKIHIVSDKGDILRNYGWPWDWNLFKRVNIIAHPGSLQSKYLYEKYGLYDISYKIVGDYELLLRPRKALNAKFMNKFTVDMTEGGASNQPKMFKELKRAILSTGEVSVFRASCDYFVHVTKLRLKNLGRKFGLNFYLKRQFR